MACQWKGGLARRDRETSGTACIGRVCRAACRLHLRQISLRLVTPQFAYDVSRTWEANAESGPFLASPTTPVPETPMKTFLGLPVRSRLGIAAGLLLNGRWVRAYAERGFDLLTYKTVRSAARPCHPMPNWVWIDDSGNVSGPVVATGAIPGDLTRLSSAVCFGMPSMHPEHWRSDVRSTVSALRPGQLLIVSVVGTPRASGSIEDLAEDFARCATWAAEAGAPVIEANLSCPNVCSSEGTLYLDADATHRVVRRIRDAIGRVPLLVKIGVLPGDVARQRFLDSVSGLVDGITLVNCIARPVLHPDGSPVFGEGFRTVGVLGRTLHEPSVVAVASLRQALDRRGLRLALVAVGGASTREDIADFFGVGADAVLCGSSPMYLPDLAIEAKRHHPEW